MKMRKGRCLLGDGREVVATYSEETPEYPWVILIDGISRYRVNNNGVRPGKPEDHETNVVEMLDNELMFEAGGMFVNEKGIPWEVKTRLMAQLLESEPWYEINSDGTFVDDKYSPLIRSREPLIVKIDKSNLRRWTNWIVMNGGVGWQRGIWRQYENKPLPNTYDRWSDPSGGRCVNVDKCDSPENIPVDRWRETLTKVPIQASDL